METHQATAARWHLSLVCALAVNQQRQIDELSNRLAVVNTAHSAPDGSFLWRITGFKSKAGLEVYSERYVDCCSCKYTNTPWSTKTCHSIFIDNFGKY